MKQATHDRIVAEMGREVEQLRAELLACANLRATIMHLRDGGPASVSSEGYAVVTGDEYHRLIVAAERLDIVEKRRARAERVEAAARAIEASADWTVTDDRRGEGAYRIASRSMDALRDALKEATP